jgi:hypothetical protein
MAIEKPKFICKDPTNFKSDSETITMFQQTKNCKDMVALYSYGDQTGYFRDVTPFSSSTRCANFSTTGPKVTTGSMSAKDMLDYFAPQCCKDSKSICVNALGKESGANISKHNSISMLFGVLMIAYYLM